VSFKISRAARAAIKSRLADPANGFNPLLLAAFSDAGVQPPIGTRLPIDYSAGSKNFFQANIGPESLLDSTPVTLPFQTLFTMSAEDRKLEKFWTFAGPVVIGINCFWSWKATAAMNDMEVVGDCYEEALVQVFNSTAAAPGGGVIADWSNRANMAGVNLVYNGDIVVRRGPLAMADENWQQEFSAVLGLDVHAH
jgi:hypothetical protein